MSFRVASPVRCTRSSAMASTGTVSTDRGTRDQDAYDLYLRGRYLFQHRGEPGLRRAAALFSEAFEAGSGFRSCTCGPCARAGGVLPEYTQTPDDTLYTAGLRNAEHAIALDQNLSDGHLALGYGLIARWQLDSSGSCVPSRTRARAE